MNYLELVEFEELNVKDEEPLRLQAEDFLHNVRTKTRPTIDAEAALPPFEPPSAFSNRPV